MQERRSKLLLAGLAVALLALAFLFVTHASSRGTRSSKRQRAVDTLVLVHSGTGRTERVGREIAAMLGAELSVVRAPFPVDPARTPVPELAGARTLYLGFPIWNERPSELARAWLGKLELRGVRVVPFYTYLHYVDPSSLAELAALVRARGGVVETPLAFLLAPSVSDAEIDQRARSALLTRPDLWSGAEPAPEPACRPGGDARQGVLCHVPAGGVWLGDTGAGSGRPGYRPPRRARVRAFAIQEHEVTIAEFTACVRSGRCARAIESPVRELGDDPGLPRAGVSFDAAKAYCAWLGMRLPDEAEWVRAGRAQGTSAFAWGDDRLTRDNRARGNFAERAATGIPHYSPLPDTSDFPSDGFRGLAPPCRFPEGKSPFGLCDLAGNLAEWTTPSAGSDTQAKALLKGGSWLDTELSALELGARCEVMSAPAGSYLSGVRCARDD